MYVPFILGFVISFSFVGFLFAFIKLGWGICGRERIIGRIIACVCFLCVLVFCIFAAFSNYVSDEWNLSEKYELSAVGNYIQGCNDDEAYLVEEFNEDSSKIFYCYKDKDDDSANTIVELKNVVFVVNEKENCESPRVEIYGRDMVYPVLFNLRERAVTKYIFYVPKGTVFKLAPEN